MRYVDELANAADLSESSLEQAIHQLFKLKGQVEKVPPMQLFLVCSPASAIGATKATDNMVKAFNETSEITISINYAGYLDIDAWFLTDGGYLVFTPGA